jgi:HSP20 family protein
LQLHPEIVAERPRPGLTGVKPAARPRTTLEIAGDCPGASAKERFMSNLTRIDPVQDIARAFESFPFRDMETSVGWPRFRSWLAQFPTEPTIKLDVTEDDKAYHVKAELPGVKKEDIAVDVEGNQVAISAEVKRDTEGKTEDVVYTERYYGKQSRSFTLAHEIDRKAAKAKFADGVLELMLPKKSNGSGSAPRIEIQ